MLLQRIKNIALFLLLVLSGCTPQGTSSVPSYPVQITLDTRIGQYVSFVPANLNDYVLVTKEGIRYHGVLYARDMGTYYGYAGVVVNINMNQTYSAFDLCCPVCLDRTKPIVIDGGFADCPTCGESYELMNGMGTPSKGISREALRRYPTRYYDGQVQVYNY